MSLFEGLTQRVTPLYNRVIFDYTLPVGALVTYLRLLALAWGSNYQVTPPLEFDGQLLPLLGVKKSQAREHLRLLRMAKLLRWTTDAGGRYTLYFPHEPDSGKVDSVVAGVLTLNTKEISIQHHLTETGLPEGGAAGPPPGNPGDLMTPVQPAGRLEGSQDDLSELGGDEVFRQVMTWLLKAGVWTDHALRIARQISENEQRSQVYLPDRSDVLGWIAFCFAYRLENEIAKPTQVLAANLSNNRRCPEKLRPTQVCLECGCLAEYCHCQAEPHLGYPKKFLEFAFTCDYDSVTQTFWGVCLSCHAYPCRCPGRDEE
jgi:hypothetical protein